MFTVFQALLDAWPYVLLVGYAVVNLLNALTPHYSQFSGAASWLTALLERLSVMTSRKADFPFKLPLASAPPNKHVSLWRKPPVAAIVGLLVIGATAAGCASVNTQAERAIVGAKAASAIAEPLFHSRCEAIAQECKEMGDTTCEQWQICSAQRDITNKAIKSVHIAANTAVLMGQIGEKTTAKEKIDEAIHALLQAYDLMVEHNLVPKRKGE